MDLAEFLVFGGRRVRGVVQVHPLYMWCTQRCKRDLAQEQAVAGEEKKKQGPADALFGDGF